MWVLQKGQIGDLALTVCKYNFMKGDFYYFELGKGVTSEAGKYLLGATKVW